jgi:hypothetical protein
MTKKTEQLGKVAANLAKLASYSGKLSQELNEGANLEPWVQDKITNATNALASVYHFLEYETKFNDYSKILKNKSLSESQLAVVNARLVEAKEKMKELKKAQAEKVKEKNLAEALDRECAECGGTGRVALAIPDEIKDKFRKHDLATRAHYAAHKRLQAEEEGMEERDMEEGFDEKSKEGDTFKTRTGVATKTATGVTHKKTDYSDEGDSEEKSGKGIKSHAKSMSASEKKDRAPHQKKSKTGTWGMENGEKFDNRKKDESVAEAKKSKPDFLDLDKDGNKKESMKKAAADKKKMDEAKAKCCCEEKGKAKCPVHGKVEESKPSAGLSKEKKSATVKAAKKGEDIGKPGKGFKKVAAKAAKEYGSKEKGEKVAAAAMWKNIKETTAYIAEKAKATSKPKWLEKAEVEAEEREGKKVSKAEEKKVGIKKESTEVDRLRELSGRLTRAEKPMVAESREVDQIRALTQKLLG